MTSFFQKPPITTTRFGAPVRYICNENVITPDKGKSMPESIHSIHYKSGGVKHLLISLHPGIEISRISR
jgi:hypothetical protein